MSDLRVANARYWSRKDHTALDKSARALRQERLLQIKRELVDMKKAARREDDQETEG